MTRKPDTEKQKKLKEKYKDFGKPNPEKEQELKEAIRVQWIKNCPLWHDAAVKQQTSSTNVKSDEEADGCRRRKEMV